MELKPPVKPHTSQHLKNKGIVGHPIMVLSMVLFFLILIFPIAIVPSISIILKDRFAQFGHLVVSFSYSTIFIYSSFTSS
jgi:hypothetical protein